MSSIVSRIRAAYARIEAVDRPEIWLDLRPQAEVEQEARTLAERVASGEQLPLAGRLFAEKPKAFRDRIAALWKHQTEDAELRVRHPAAKPDQSSW